MSISPSLGRTFPSSEPNNEGNRRERNGVAVTDISLIEKTEIERIERWRAEELERAGYEPRAAGRLAVQLGGRSRGTIDQRIRNAAAAIAALGGDVDVVRDDDATRIRGRGCPLSAAVSKTPEVCLAMETLVTEVAGADARTCCVHGERPQCCFAIERAG